MFGSTKSLALLPIQKTKKGKRLLIRILQIYGLFRTIRKVAIAIAITMATTETIMYIIRSFVVAKPTGEGVGVAGVGVAVAGACTTNKPAAAEDVAYESVPAKVAVIVYVSGFGGVHGQLNVP